MFMHPVMLLLYFSLCHHFLIVDAVILNCVPRKSISFNDKHIKTFKEKGFYNYSVMLLREDIDTLLVCAREAIYALNMDDVSNKISKVSWPVLENKQLECTNKGKSKDIECRNYIRTLHRINDSMMYVCGTNAFSPTCHYMDINNGQLQLLGPPEEGKGKCPFDPFQKYSSVMVDSDLYTATSINFLGSEPVVTRNSANSLRTEFKPSWLNEPKFIYMDLVEESHNNPEGEEEDDKIYLFFSETAVEYDFYDKLLVSRIARVCKGDLGGLRILQKKWTTFLKASLVCSVPDLNLQFIIQDVFMLKSANWRDTIFYGVFVPQAGVLDISIVCAYSMRKIHEVFSQGKYKEPVTVDSSHVKWIVYNQDVPVPRPGACINNQARNMKINRTLDLPDKTLQFVRDHPLMDDPVTPIDGKPKLIKTGSRFTSIVVDRIKALDNQLYDVMFIGTDNGYLQKAINLENKMFIIEEAQLFKNEESILSLRISSKKRKIYATSLSQVAQSTLSDCRHYETCYDCVLARDPYCAWSKESSRCTSISDMTNNKTDLIQNVKTGDASSCKDTRNIREVTLLFVPSTTVHLECSPLSNLATVHWTLNNSSIQPNETKYIIYNGGIFILNTSMEDIGRYVCYSVEKVRETPLKQVMMVYILQSTQQNMDKPIKPLPPEVETQSPSAVTEVTPRNIPNHSYPGQPKIPMPQTTNNIVLILEVAVVVLSCLLASLLTYNICKGHITVCCVNVGKKGNHNSQRIQPDGICDVVQQDILHNKTAKETIPLVSGFAKGEHVNNNKGHCSDSQKPSIIFPTLDDLKYIDDESEI
ncbi:semaphorin-4E [Polypterus senegalus]|uniref:semaphorin-4E n=1 Tax=Polypterus senegalus TaxID=55291 RepID=UPI0019630CCD|nr:semaphorin-4E [Polypterus senegalus]XP_039622813.1 semaphorin-4E [Polypterus senegalus]XP_039622814.1 semaphorin-4E [Polypterus senegalus]